jgi:putative ABC transport system substrate-binding protein
VTDAAVVPLHAAEPPGRIPHIGFLSLTWRSPNQQGLTDGLRAHGYIEGKNILIDYRYAEGSDARLAEMAAELAAANLDLIVAVAPPAAAAARKATTKIPIVFSSISDPVGMGLAETMARPGGNVTGVANMPSDLNLKRLQLLKSALPDLKRVAIVARTGNQNSQIHLASQVAMAEQLGLDARVFNVGGPDDFEATYAAIVQDGREAICAVQDSLLFAHRERLMGLAVKHRLPVIADNREYAEAGALIAYGTPAIELYRRAADYVHKILDGANPATLPIEQPLNLELVINLRVGRELGINVPLPLIARATQLIE